MTFFSTLFWTLAAAVLSKFRSWHTDRPPDPIPRTTIRWPCAIFARFGRLQRICSRIILIRSFTSSCALHLLKYNALHGWYSFDRQWARRPRAHLKTTTITTRLRDVHSDIRFRFRAERVAIGRFPTIYERFSPPIHVSRLHMYQHRFLCGAAILRVCSAGIRLGRCLPTFFHSTSLSDFQNSYIFKKFF